MKVLWLYFPAGLPKSGKLPVLDFTHSLKISIVALHGRLVAPIHMKFGVAEGTMGPLRRTKFCANLCMEVGTRYPKVENSHILVKSRLQGQTVWPISTVVEGFYTPNYPALVFYIWLDSLYRLQSYCWETVHWSFTPKISVHLIGKNMCWIEKWFHLF